MFYKAGRDEQIGLQTRGSCNLWTSMAGHTAYIIHCGINESVPIAVLFDPLTLFMGRIMNLPQRIVTNSARENDNKLFSLPNMVLIMQRDTPK